MDKDLMYTRVLEHDTQDSIRIGVMFPIDNTPAALEKEAQSVIEAYETKSEWCGGFAAACEKYYKRVAIVDADTLAVLHIIYERKEEK